MAAVIPVLIGPGQTQLTVTPAGAELHRKLTGQPDHPVLGGDVRRHVAVAPEALGRGHIHDPPRRSRRRSSSRPGRTPCGRSGSRPGSCSRPVSNFSPSIAVGHATPALLTSPSIGTESCADLLAPPGPGLPACATSAATAWTWPPGLGDLAATAAQTGAVAIHDAHLAPHRPAVGGGPAHPAGRPGDDYHLPGQERLRVLRVGIGASHGMPSYAMAIRREDEVARRAGWRPWLVAPAAVPAHADSTTTPNDPDFAPCESRPPPPTQPPVATTTKTGICTARSAPAAPGSLGPMAGCPAGRRWPMIPSTQPEWT